MPRQNEESTVRIVSCPLPTSSSFLLPLPLLPPPSSPPSSSSILIPCYNLAAESSSPASSSLTSSCSSQRVLWSNPRRGAEQSHSQLEGQGGWAMLSPGQPAQHPAPGRESWAQEAEGPMLPRSWAAAYVFRVFPNVVMPQSFTIPLLPSPLSEAPGHCFHCTERLTDLLRQYPTAQEESQSQCWV